MARAAGWKGRVEVKRNGESEKQSDLVTVKEGADQDVAGPSLLS